MFNKRLVNFIIAFTLVIIIAFAAREAFATTGVELQRDTAKQATTSESSSLPSRYSIHTEYVQAKDTLLTSTEDGPRGVDGGLMHLFSKWRECTEAKINWQD
jgi:hypothetical protein